MEYSAPIGNLAGQRTGCQSSAGAFERRSRRYAAGAAGDGRSSASGATDFGEHDRTESGVLPYERDRDAPLISGKESRRNQAVSASLYGGYPPVHDQQGKRRRDADPADEAEKPVGGGRDLSI